MPRGTESPMIKYRKICRNCPAYPPDEPYVPLEPVAFFTYTEDGLEITLTEDSDDIDGVATYFWDFGDGNTSTLQHPVHTYAAGGTYTVTLTVTTEGGSDDFSRIIDVAGAGLAPVANFSYTNDGLEVTFTDLSTNTPTSWSWTYDGTPFSTAQNPVYTFPDEGAHEIVLTATNAFGSDDYALEVEVYPDDAINTNLPELLDEPTAAVVLDYDPGVWTGATSVEAQAQIADTIGGVYTNVGSSWTVGVDTPYTPTYANVGKYMRVVETAQPGNVTAISNPYPTPTGVTAMTFQVTTTGASQILTIQELRTVIGQAVNVDWGDGLNNNYTSTGSTGNNRTHTYASAGTYTVTINLPLRITHFDIRDTKISDVQGSELAKFRELTNLRILTVPDGVLDWTVSTTHPMPPLIQYLQIELQTNIIWTVSTTNPMPPINDVLNLRGATGITWTIDSTTPMPPLVESFTIRDMPTVDYVSSAEFVLDLSTVRVESAWDTTMLDAFLRDLYIAFPSRTVSGGTVDLLGGSNGVPSGVLAVMCPPTTGKARAYELVNDSCGVSANHWTSITTS